MKIIVLAITFFLIFTSFGQNDSTSTGGEIIDGEIVIEKEKKITLPKANKIFSKTELKTYNTEPLLLDFLVLEPTFNWPEYVSNIPFQKVNNQYPVSDYQSYVKAGFGNYSAPLVEVGIYKEVGQLMLSSGLSYESFAEGPVNDDFSGSSSFEFDLSAKYETDKISIAPYFNIENNQFNFFGNTDRINSGFSDETPAEGFYNLITFGTRLNGGNNNFKYRLNGNINKSSQESGISINEEPLFNVAGDISIKIDTSFIAGINLEGHLSNFKTGFTYDRSLFVISPWVKRSKNSLSITAGFRLASNQSFNVSNSGFYPYLSSEWKFSPDWSTYGVIDGGFDWKDLSQHISQNQFLDDSLVIQNTETNLIVKGGLKGQLVKNLNLNTSLSFGSVTNLPLIIPSISDSSRFTITYDNQKIQVVTFNIGLSYTPNIYSNFGAEVEFSNYSMNSIDEAWHLPTFQLKAYSTYNINQKLIFSASVISLSGIKAPVSSSNNYIDLPMILDLGVGLNYLINNRISTFVSSNNLFNNEYERYIGYPVRGMTFKIGGKYRF